jgi:hypothetical protein
VPNSEAKLDLCGVCGGDNSACCFLSVAQSSVHIRGASQTIANAVHILDAGETLAVTNLDFGHSYTFVLLRLDLSAGSGAIGLPGERVLRKFEALQPGHKLKLVIGEPGEYELTAMESAMATVRISVRYNAKRIDARTGQCGYPHIDDDDNDQRNRMERSSDREQLGGGNAMSPEYQQLQSLVVLILTIVGCVTLMVLAVSVVVVSVIKSQARRNQQHPTTSAIL